MENGEVAEIVRLEGQAAKAEKASSADRWHAAKLINDQLARKTYRQLSQDIKEAGGKGSIGHLERMKKCWEIFGMAQYEAYKDDYERYPNFADAYGSDEVRGENREKGGDGDRDPGDVGADGLAQKARECLETLAEDRAYLSLLSDNGLENIRQCRDIARSLLRERAV